MNYETYKAAIIAQGSRCYMGREQWEESKRREREGHSTVFEVTSKTAQLAPGWYINDFLPYESEPITTGPFSSEAAARGDL